MGNKKNVLFLEDESLLRAFFKTGFDMFLPEFNVVFAKNGVEAIGILKENDFDLIISDIRMPLMNGIEFRNRLLKCNKRKDIPFMFVSSSPQDIPVVMNAGIKVLKKPLLLKDMADEVHSFLSYKDTATPSECLGHKGDKCKLLAGLSL